MLHTMFINLFAKRGPSCLKPNPSAFGIRA
jgi:hypothetical protein